MNKTEFNQFTNLMKKYYPEFDFFSSEVANLWFKDVSTYDYRFIASCLEKYVSSDKTRRPPSLGVLNAIIKDNYVPEEKTEVYRQNWVDERFHQDVELGRCNYNRYIYHAAYDLYKKNIEISFEDALQTVCLERTGHIKEFPSQKELEEAGFAKDIKLSPKEAKDLLETYFEKGCNL